MAADTMVSDGDTKCTVTKMWRVPGGIVGIAGDMARATLFVAWLKAGADQDDLPDMRDVDALMLTTDGRILCYNDSATPFEIRDPFAAIGAGAQAALGAMHMGATPVKAIHIASQIHPGTGGKICRFTLQGKQY